MCVMCVCVGGASDCVDSVPDGSGVEEVMDYLRSHSTSQKGVELGLTALLSLLPKQGGEKTHACFACICSFQNFDLSIRYNRVFQELQNKAFSFDIDEVLVEFYGLSKN